MRTAASGSSISPICPSGRVFARRCASNGVVHIEWEGEAHVRHLRARLARRACLRPRRAATRARGAAVARGRAPRARPTSPARASRSCAPRRRARLSLAHAAAAGRPRLSRTTCRLRDAAILEVMPLVGRVLETNYGLTFDVRSVPQPRESRLLRSRARPAHRQPLSRAGTGLPGAARARRLERRRRQSVRGRLRAGRAPAAQRARCLRTADHDRGALPLPLARMRTCTPSGR